MVALCLLVFFWQNAVGYSGSVEVGALYGPYVVAGEWWRLATSAFMHAGAVHLGMNMLSLVMLGRLLEPLYQVGGRWCFPTLYVGSLLGGSIGALFFEFHSPVVGASGAVFGLAGASIALPMRLGSGANRFGALPWLLLNLVVTVTVPGISIGGHLGGLAAGFALGWWLAPVEHLEDQHCLGDTR